MRKTVYIFILFLLLLASCNYPLKKSTPDASQVATLVAQTLSAQEALTTPTPSQSAAAETPSVTATPEQTPTGSPTPTPTVSPEDPAVELGSPAYLNSLDNGRSFFIGTPVYTDDAVEIRVANGVMSLQSLAVGQGRRWRLANPVVKDFYLEGTFITQSCLEDDNAGLVFRAPDYSDGYGYYLGLTCSGLITLTAWTDAGRLPVETFESSAVLGGSGQTNRLGVKADGSKFSIYVNGVFAGEVEDDSIQDAGYFGVFIEAVSSPDSRVELDQIAYWNLP